VALGKTYNCLSDNGQTWQSHNRSSSGLPLTAKIKLTGRFHRRQVIGSSIIAIAAGYGGWRVGMEPQWAALSAVATYIVCRWLIAWAIRIRFWYRNGSHDNSQPCPGCGQPIYRLSGDWILECKRCGWRAGLPGLRWLTRSVPSRQLRRTVGGVHLVVLIGLAVVVAAGGPLAASETVGDIGADVRSLTDDFESVGVAADDAGTDVRSPANDSEPSSESAGVAADGAGADVGGPADGSESSSGPAGVAADDAGTDESAESINREAVREQFRKLLNGERQSRGLQTLSQRSVLREMGQSHAETMATHDYVGHQSPSGKTIRDRYQERGLLPECRLPKSDSARYYPGAENAAQTWVNKPLIGLPGPDEIVTNEGLARGLFEMWMQSPLHREAMLVSSADEMGLGIKIHDNGKVFAALELC